MEKSLYPGIYPVQPFFIINTGQYFKVKMPESPVVHFYTFHSYSNIKNISAMPDGCVDLLFSFYGEQAKGYVYGTVTKSRPIEIKADHTYFGVRLKPGYLPTRIGVSIPELVDTRVPINDFTGGERLIELLREAGVFERRIGILLNYIDELRESTSLLKTIMALIEELNGDIHISELECKTGYTSRYINRLFKNQLGISTKDFTKFVRFQAVIQRMNNNSKENLSNIAADFGYFDQSHFLKEFKEFTSVTPRDYRAFIDLPNYRKKIVDCSAVFNRS